MEKTFRNVCEVIVANDYCIGCGVCAGICPVNVLEMKLNNFGESQPEESRPGCLPKCDLCFRGCPFWNQEKNEDTLARELFGNEKGIEYYPLTGFSLGSYVGYSNKDGHRANGASGGMATWLLETLLTEREVDFVVHVTHNPDPGKLFTYTVSSSVEEIRKGSRSCYYPVELSEVIDFIILNEGRYVIIGLPCFVKGLRLASQISTKLKSRIRYLFGLVCGQMKSTLFSSYLCALKGGDPQSMDYCQFRIKDAKRNANDYGFSFHCNKGDIRSDTIFWNEGMREVWVNGYFKINACNYCDDIFAELADVVLLDAWIERYIQDPKGTNFLLCRNLALQNLLLKGLSEGEIHLEDVTLEEIIQSQEGVVESKRKDLAGKLALAKILGKKYLPRKRVSPSGSNSITLLERYLEQYVSNKSKLVMSKFGINKGMSRLRQTTTIPLSLLNLLRGVRNRLSISYLTRQINRLRK